VKHLLCVAQGANCKNNMAYFLLQLQDTDKVSNVTTCCECNYVNIKLSPELECYESAEIPDDEMTLEMNGVFYVGGGLCAKLS